MNIYNIIGVLLLIVTLIGPFFGIMTHFLGLKDALKTMSIIIVFFAFIVLSALLINHK